MRQRKIKDLDSKYKKYTDLIEYDPENKRGLWREISGERDLYVEIGCGKGKFITEMAAKHPENFYVAVEGNMSVMLRALQKADANELSNIIFIPKFTEDIRDWFSEDEAAGIYLNFSDPLPKKYCYKKRLTYRDRLISYFDIIRRNGKIEFKTDNTAFFEWTIGEIIAANLSIEYINRDLHSSDEENIMTEYENKFSTQGEKIKKLIISQNVKEGRNDDMGIKSMAAYNGRNIPEEDKVFSASKRAKAMAKEKGKDAVINATIGSLLDDEGNLVVMKSIDKAMKSLSASEYAEYAPIAGIEGFKKAILKATFGTCDIKSFTRVVATPGGTGAIRNTVANYSCPGDKVLTHNWHWAPYKNIVEEMGRGLECFDLFNECGEFNVEDFAYKVRKLTRNQEHLVIIINTPANNPTGYSLSIQDWNAIKNVLDEVDKSKKIALLIDVAYIDFAGEETETRQFFSVADNLGANILPIVAYSASKTFSLYGFRCAAMICMANNPEVADEFERVCTFSSRASWSNSPRAPQTIIQKIFEDEKLLDETKSERAKYREMLQKRGDAFSEESEKVGLEILPFKAGFFVTIPCSDPEELCVKLEQKGVFLIPISGGVRVSIASINECTCRRLPAIINEALAGVV